MGDTQIIIEPGKQDIVFKREFDAPREIVFRALTDPSLIPNWWGPRIYETIVDNMDARPGGTWRFINRSPEFETGFHGVYHEVSPDRIVQTTEWEGMPGHVGLETATLEERDGKTLMTAVVAVPVGRGSRRERRQRHGRRRARDLRPPGRGHPEPRRAGLARQAARDLVDAAGGGQIPAQGREGEPRPSRSGAERVHQQQRRTITPSAPALATARTCSGRETPKPTATGSGETFLTRPTSAASVVGGAERGAGHAGQRNAVDEAAGAVGDELDAFRRCRWCDEVDQREAVSREGRLERRAFVGRADRPRSRPRRRPRPGVRRRPSRRADPGTGWRSPSPAPVCPAARWRSARPTQATRQGSRHWPTRPSSRAAG